MFYTKIYIYIFYVRKNKPNNFSINILFLSVSTSIHNCNTDYYCLFRSRLNSFVVIDLHCWQIDCISICTRVATHPLIWQRRMRWVWRWLLDIVCSHSIRESRRVSDIVSWLTIAIYASHIRLELCAIERRWLSLMISLVLVAFRLSYAYHVSFSNLRIQVYYINR